MSASNDYDINELLDSNLDDLADLPEFKNIQPGVHKVSIGFGTKIINDEKYVEVKVKLIETLELADPSGTPDEPGTESATIYNLSNEFGQGGLKELCKPLGESLGETSLGKILQGAEGMEVTIVSTIRPDKKDKDRKYFGIKSLQVA